VEGYKSKVGMVGIVKGPLVNSTKGRENEPTKA
jgi:hypothetical protein